MTTTNQLREAIIAKILPIPNIGPVHAYQRFLKQPSKLQELYTLEGKLLGWNLQRVGLKKTALGDAVYNMRNRWELTGYMSLEDEAESELKFDLLVDLVQLQLSNDPTFGALGAWPENYELNVKIEPVMFCTVLCHQAVVSFDTEHEELVNIDQTLDEFLTLYSQYDIKPHESKAEHNKWLEQPPNYSTSKPDLQDTTKLQE